MTLSPERLEKLEDVLVELNRASAAHILPLFRAEHGLRDKGGAAGFDPVTEADIGAEKVIRGLLQQLLPDHGVIGEELGEERPGSSCGCWTRWMGPGPSSPACRPGAR